MSRVMSLILIALVAMIAGCNNPAIMEKLVAENAELRKQNADLKDTQKVIREAAESTVAEDRAKHGSEDSTDSQKSSDSDAADAPPLLQGPGAQPSGQSGQLAVHPDGSTVLGATRGLPGYNPRACGLEGPYVGYTSGFPYQLPGVLYDRRNTPPSCQGGCLYVTNAMRRDYVLFMTMDSGERVPVTICAGFGPSYASGISRLGRGYVGVASVLRYGQTVSIGKIYGLATVEIAECVTDPGRPLRCGDLRTLVRVQFPTNGENGYHQVIGPLA